MNGAAVSLLAVAVALALACLLQFWLTAVGSAEGMGPNRMVGIKTRASLASDEAWRAGHEAAQPALLAAGLTGCGAAIPIGVAEWLTDGSAGLALTAAAALTTVAVLVLGGSAVLRANRAARRAEADGGS